MDKETEKDKSFLQSVKEELQIETFTKDEKDFSPEKVQALVQLLELEDDIDEAEIYAAQERFKKNFKEKNRKLVKANKRKRVFKGILQTAAVFAMVFIVGDVSARAIWNEGLFHMITAGNQWLFVSPGKTENGDFEESETIVFNTMEEFVDDFKNDFLVCNSLSDGANLVKIEKYTTDDSSVYTFLYENEKIEDWNLVLRIYENHTNSTAGVVNTQLDEATYYKTFDNGIEAAVYEREDGYLIGFDYNGQWYLIETNADEATLFSIIEGMKIYEHKEN